MYLQMSYIKVFFVGPRFGNITNKHFKQCSYNLILMLHTSLASCDPLVLPLHTNYKLPMARYGVQMDYHSSIVELLP